MTANGVEAAASAIRNVRPQAHSQFRLLPVPSPAVPLRDWNERIARWAGR